jgi:hypothetical protein
LRCAFAFAFVAVQPEHAGDGGGGVYAVMGVEGPEKSGRSRCKGEESEEVEV